MASNQGYDTSLKREIISLDEEFNKENRYGKLITKQLRRTWISGSTTHIDTLRLLTDLSMLCFDFGAQQSAEMFARQVSNECDMSASVEGNALKEVNTERIYMSRDFLEQQKQVAQRQQQQQVV